MTRSQLITAVAETTETPEAQVCFVLDTIVDQIADSLADGEKVTIAGLGRFEMSPRKPKAFVNPKTKESVQLDATSIVHFKASGLLKEKVEGNHARAYVDI